MKKILVLTLLINAVLASAQVAVRCCSCGGSGEVLTEQGKQECRQCGGIGSYLVEVPTGTLVWDAEEYMYLRDVELYSYNPKKDKFVKKSKAKLYLHNTKLGIELLLDKSWCVQKCTPPMSDHFTFFIEDTWEGEPFAYFFN